MVFQCRVLVLEPKPNSYLIANQNKFVKLNFEKSLGEFKIVS